MQKTHYYTGFVLSLILFSHSLYAQPGITQETRRLTGSYHSIQVSSGIQLDIIKGDVESATVNASTQNLRSKIKTVIMNDTLKVFFYYKDDPNWKGLVKSKERFKVSIHQTDLKAINAEEGAEVNCVEEISAEQLSIKLKSGSALTAKVTCKKLTADVIEGSELKLAGNADDAVYKVASGSTAANQKLRTFDCTAIVYSLSILKIAAERSLKVVGKNKARIYNSGHPLQVNKNLTDNSSLN